MAAQPGLLVADVHHPVAGQVGQQAGLGHDQLFAQPLSIVIPFNSSYRALAWGMFQR